MADFFFFTDIDLLQSQTSSDAFGPSSTDPNNKYQVTSLHKGITDGNGNNPKAYAICSGEVFIQKDAIDPINLVSLILKPSQSNTNNLPRIKYIIYKGIRRDSLINGTDIASPTNVISNNDLTTRIWNDHTGTPPITALDPNNASPLAPTDYIYKYFFTNAGGTKSQLPKVDAGESLGRFDINGFGIEIILDYIGFEPTLQFASNPVNFISCTPLSGSPTPKELFNQKMQKEQVFAFMDICGFLGSFFDDKIKVKDSSGSTNKKNGEEIYKDILDGANPAAKFVNRNKVYLDVRNELNYSFNYFGNYQNSINVAFSDSTALNSFTPLSYDNGWPIFVLDTEFPAGNTTNENIIRLSFPQGDNSKPIIFVSQGHIILPSIERKKGKKCFQILSFPLTGSYTNSVKFVVPNYTLNNNTTSISSYLRLKYLRQVTQCPAPLSSGTVIRSTEFLDNIFRPLEMSALWDSDPATNLLVNTYNEDIYIDALTDSGQSFMADVGIAKSSSGDVSLFTFASKKMISNKRIKSKLFTITPESKVNEAGIDNGLLSYIGEDFKLDIEDISLSIAGVRVPVKRLKKRGFPIISSFTKPNVADFYEITFSQSDFNSIQTTAFPAGQPSTFLQGHKIHLGLKYVLGDIDDFGSQYVKYQFVLRGFIVDPSDANNIIFSEVPVLNSGNPVYYYRRLNVPDLERNPPKIKGKHGYSVTTQGTQNYTEPNGQIINNIPVYKINCKIYLIRGWNVSQDEFCQLSDFVYNNIQEVWNSSSNNGLGSTYNLSFNPSGQVINPLADGNFTRSHIIDASGVTVEVATVEQFEKIKDGEVIFEVLKSSHRSFVRGDRRTGYMFYYPPNVPGTTYVPNAPNTAAHEFGHILNLTDHYTYVGRFQFRTTDNGGNNSPIMDGHYGGAVGIFHRNADGTLLGGGSFDGNSGSGYAGLGGDVGGDPDYGRRYNWMNNLMSTQTNIDNSTGTATYNKFKEYYKPTLPNSNPNPRITVFVTSRQLKYVVDRISEPDTKRYVNFKEVTATNNGAYHGTFVGPCLNPKTNPSVYSDTMDIIASDDGYSAPLSNIINNFDHDMDKRMLSNPLETNSDNYQPLGNVVAYYSPYISSGGSPVLIENDIVDDDSLALSQLYPLDDPLKLLYDIETGGHAFNKVDALSVVPNTDSLLRTTLSSINNPYPSQINSVVPAYKGLPVITPGQLDKWRENMNNLGINGVRIQLYCLWWAAANIKTNNASTQYERTNQTIFQLDSVSSGAISLNRSFNKNGGNIGDSDAYGDEGSGSIDSGNGKTPRTIDGKKIWRTSIKASEKQDTWYLPDNNPSFNRMHFSGRLLKDGCFTFDIKGNTKSYVFHLDFDYYLNRQYIYRLIRDSFLT